jgi:hypothetical protein
VHDTTDPQPTLTTLIGAIERELGVAGAALAAADNALRQLRHRQAAPPQRPAAIESAAR